MGKATRVRKTRAVATPNRAARRAVKQKPRAQFVVFVPTKNDPLQVVWLHGADPWAAPAHLRKAVQVMERHLGLETSPEQPNS